MFDSCDWCYSWLSRQPRIKRIARMNSTRLEQFSSLRLSKRDTLLSVRKRASRLVSFLSTTNSANHTNRASHQVQDCTFGMKQNVRVGGLSVGKQRCEDAEMDLRMGTVVCVSVSLRKELLQADGKAPRAKTSLAVFPMRDLRILCALHRSTALRRFSAVTLRRTTAFL
jgi:hypothetical protein